MSDAAERTMMRELASAIGAPSVPLAESSEADRPATDRAATAVLDTLLRRAGRLAASIDAAPLSAADDHAAAAQLLLADLALVTALLRALDRAAGDRLEQVAAELQGEQRRLADLLGDVVAGDAGA